MSTHNKEKSSKFRLSLIDDKTHKQLVTLHFTKAGFVITIITILVILCAAIYSIVAFTPVRTFIPGYPDARSKRAAIQNVITIDSLKNVIFRWELYSENLRRVIEGEEPIRIDSLINSTRDTTGGRETLSEAGKKDSLLREHVRKEEQFGISVRNRRNLPIEGRHFFTPVEGVISQGYEPALHPYIDITAPAGSVVKATLDGTVIFSGWSDEAGNTIQIQHDGDIVSIYKHNDKLLKKSGDKVTAGTPIAIIGNTGGLTTGDHLHFELWHKGETVDPAKFINF